MRKLLLLVAAAPLLALAQTPGAPPYPGAPPAAPGQATNPGPAAAARRNLAQPEGAAPAAAPAPAPPSAVATPTQPPPPPARGSPARGTARVRPAPEPAPEPGNAGGSARADGSCVPLQGRFLLAFNKAEIVDVLEQASRWTCRNFAYTEDIARGKITLLSKTPVTSEEAYAAFLAALTANNIAVYPSGKYYKLVRIADAKKTPIPTLLDDGSEAPAMEQPVTKIYKLHFADPDQLRGVLGNFTSPQGADIQSLPPDTLIITDIGLNMRRIERIIDAIDKPGSGELIRFIQVRYASARDLAEKVNQIFQATPGQPGKPGRRPVIGGVAPPGGAPAPAAPGGSDELSISKVMADERTNKLVVIADEKSFQRIRDLVEQLDLPTAGEGQIHVVFMKNANAEDLAQTLQALAQGQSSARRAGGAPGAAVPQPVPAAPVPGAAGAAGATSAALFAGDVKITADKVSNSLIVLANGSDFATIQRLIDKLDRQRRQVFVEAAILEVNLSNERQLGVSMHTAIPYKTSDGTGYIPLGSETGRVNSFSPLSLVSLGGFLSGVVGPTSAQLQDVLPGVPSLSVLIQALQTSSDVNVISTPHILASDNEDAEITVGQNVPFQAGIVSPGLTGLTSAATGTTTGTTNPAASLAGFGGLLGSVVAPIQRQNVELRLRIKPQITEGDNVRLLIDEQNEDIQSRDPQLGPTTNKRTIKTNISVKDQSTIVIGGLIQDRAIQAVHKIPLLGDIPVLGWLFRDTVTTKQKTNLLLFLTPYIIKDPSDYRRIYERKRKDQQDFIDAFYGKQEKFEPYVDYARKAGPYTKVRRDIATEAMRFENGGAGAPGERSVTPPSTPAQPPPAPGDLGIPPAPPPEQPLPSRPDATPGMNLPEEQPSAPAEPVPGTPGAPVPGSPSGEAAPAPGEPAAG